jgi:o-succinylbenzoate---CoA ligase
VEARVADLAPPASYFDPDVTRVDWQSEQTLVTVNPEWLRRDAAQVTQSVRELPAVPAHVWVATSGSSSTVPGHIRWVALSKQAFLASAAAVNAHLESDRADIWAHALPVFHVGGLGILARASLSGAPVEPAVAGRWDAWRFHARLVETRATLTALVPSQVHDLVGARLHAPASLRAIVVGGARLDPELCADARRLGWRCLPSYGLTETCSQVATAALGSSLSPVCTGPLPILRHATIRSDGEQRLHIRAPSLMTCYAEMTAAGMQAWDPKVDGWLETEDLGHVTGAGVEVLGRATDSVKVLGETVSVPRVEEVVRRWVGSLAPPFVGLDVAVVALPHPRLGHELVVVLAPTAPDVVSGSGRTQDDPLPSLLAYCQDLLLPYERPHRIAWVDRIPRTALGKCQRPLLAREVSLQPGTQG